MPVEGLPDLDAANPGEFGSGETAANPETGPLGEHSDRLIHGE